MKCRLRRLTISRTGHDISWLSGMFEFSGGWITFPVTAANAIKPVDNSVCKINLSALQRFAQAPLVSGWRHIRKGPIKFAKVPNKKRIGLRDNFTHFADANTSLAAFTKPLTEGNRQITKFSVIKAENVFNLTFNYYFLLGNPQYDFCFDFSLSFSQFSRPIAIVFDCDLWTDSAINEIKKK